MRHCLHAGWCSWRAPCGTAWTPSPCSYLGFAPGGVQCLTTIGVLARRPLRLTGATRRCLNLGSYNYLGFAAADEYCTPRVLDTMRHLGWSMCSSRTDAGPFPEL